MGNNTYYGLQTGAAFMSAISESYNKNLMMQANLAQYEGQMARQERQYQDDKKYREETLNLKKQEIESQNSIGFNTPEEVIKNAPDGTTTTNIKHVGNKWTGEYNQLTASQQMSSFKYNELLDLKNKIDNNTASLEDRANYAKVVYNQKTSSTKPGEKGYYDELNKTQDMVEGTGKILDLMKTLKGSQTGLLDSTWTKIKKGTGNLTAEEEIFKEEVTRLQSILPILNGDSRMSDQDVARLKDALPSVILNDDAFKKAIYYMNSNMKESVNQQRQLLSDLGFTVPSRFSKPSPNEESVTQQQPNSPTISKIGNKQVSLELPNSSVPINTGLTIAEQEELDELYRQDKGTK